MYRGVISTIDNENSKARVIIKDKDGVITPELPIASHVGLLQINDNVAVDFFSNSLSDGLIMARW